VTRPVYYEYWVIHSPQLDLPFKSRILWILGDTQPTARPTH
jgi:hypothetical protein